MKLSSPTKLLVLLVIANALTLTAVCFIVDAAPHEKVKVALLCGFSFLLTSGFALLVSKSVLSDFVEPWENAVSKILAAVGKEARDLETKGLPELTAVLVDELENARQRERLIADYASDILLCLDDKRLIIELNLQSEMIWEYPILTLIATPVEKLVVDEDRPAFLQYLEACKQDNTGKLHECRIRTLKGRLIDLEWQAEWSQNLKCFFCLARNISDRKENQRLRAEITAMVGHDLRAPVTSLSFMLQNLTSGTFGDVPQPAVEPIKRSQAAIKQMLLLINQLLDAEKIEGGALEVDKKIVPVCEIYEQAKSLLADFYERRGLKIDVPDSTALVTADFDRSCQIFCNLLSNAIKWAPENSTITVDERIEGSHITISITDRGPGVPPEKQSTLFERFKSQDNRADKIVASSGLGLYLSKKLTELQGGRIGFKSKPEEGTTFWFSLEKASEQDLPGYLD